MNGVQSGWLAALDASSGKVIWKAWSTGPDPEDSIKIGTVCPPWDSGKGAGLGSYCYAESIENIDASPEHYAIVINTPSTNKPVLTRLHSECFTGDLLG